MKYGLECQPLGQADEDAPSRDTGTADEGDTARATSLTCADMPEPANPPSTGTAAQLALDEAPGVTRHARSPRF